MKINLDRNKQKCGSAAAVWKVCVEEYLTWPKLVFPVNGR